jgi:hypothetical protein
MSSKEHLYEFRTPQQIANMDDDLDGMVPGEAVRKNVNWTKMAELDVD